MVEQPIRNRQVASSTLALGSKISLPPRCYTTPAIGRTDEAELSRHVHIPFSCSQHLAPQSNSGQNQTHFSGLSGGQVTIAPDFLQIDPRNCEYWNG